MFGKTDNLLRIVVDETIAYDDFVEDQLQKHHQSGFDHEADPYEEKVEKDTSVLGTPGVQLGIPSYQVVVAQSYPTLVLVLEGEGCILILFLFSSFLCICFYRT